MAVKVAINGLAAGKDTYGKADLSGGFTIGNALTMKADLKSHQLPVLAPTVSVEGVIAANPEAIIASGMDEARPEWLDDWKRWGTMRAVASGNLYFVPPDLIQRHTPRILDGAEMLGAHLETVRGKRGR